MSSPAGSKPAELVLRLRAPRRDLAHLPPEDPEVSPRPREARRSHFHLSRPLFHMEPMDASPPNEFPAKSRPSRLLHPVHCGIMASLPKLLGLSGIIVFFTVKTSLDSAVR